MRTGHHHHHPILNGTERAIVFVSCNESAVDGGLVVERALRGSCEGINLNSRVVDRETLSMDRVT